MLNCTALQNKIEARSQRPNPASIHSSRFKSYPAVIFKWQLMWENTWDSEVLVCDILLCKNMSQQIWVYFHLGLLVLFLFIGCLRFSIWLFSLFLSHRYYVCVVVLIYFLPLLIMGCAYLVVGCTLWASQIPGDSSDRYREQLTAKRKVMICRATHIKA